MTVRTMACALAAAGVAMMAVLKAADAHFRMVTRVSNIPTPAVWAVGPVSCHVMITLYHRGMLASHDPADLEFSVDDMRRMAGAVTERAIEHIATLAAQPSCGDVGAENLARSLREPVPEQPSALEPLLDGLFDEWIPRSFNAPGPGYLAYIPGGGLFPAA